MLPRECSLPWGIASSWLAISLLAPAVAMAGVPKDSIIRQATVRVEGQGSSGSGVIIRSEAGVYTVLTAAHVVDCKAPGSEEITLVTWDGQRHAMQTGSLVCPPKSDAAESPSGMCDSSNNDPWAIDLALLRFSSTTIYRAAAKLRDIHRNGQRVIVASYPLASTDLAVSPSDGPASPPPQSLASTCKGYGLRYVAQTMVGMSGGGVWTEKGELAGIHGYRIVNRNRSDAQEQHNAFSAAVPIGYWTGMANRWTLSLKTAPSTGTTAGGSAAGGSAAGNFNVRDLISQAQNLISRIQQDSGDAALLRMILPRLEQARQLDLQQPLIPGMQAQVYLYLYKKAGGRPDDLARALEQANIAVDLSRKWSGSYDGRFERIRAEVHALRGNPQKALIDIDTRLAKVPGDASALKDKANYGYQAGDYMAALDALSKALSINPWDPGALVDRGLVLTRLSMAQEACGQWQQAINAAAQLETRGGIYANEASNQEKRARDYSQMLGCR